VLAVAALALACAGACSAEPGAAAAGDASWRAELLDERAPNEAEFRTSPTSPLTAVERRELRGPGPVYVQADQETVRIADAAGGRAALAFRAAGPERWVWERIRGDVTATARG